MLIGTSKHKSMPCHSEIAPRATQRGCRASIQQPPPHRPLSRDVSARCGAAARLTQSSGERRLFLALKGGCTDHDSQTPVDPGACWFLSANGTREMRNTAFGCTAHLTLHSLAFGGGRLFLDVRLCCCCGFGGEVEEGVSLFLPRCSTRLLL